MRIGTTLLVVGLTVALAGCGSAGSQHTSSDSILLSDGSSSFNNFGPEWQAETNAAGLMPKENAAPDFPTDDEPVVQPPIAQPRCPEGPIAHFDTPEAAMTYLAAAWNRNDLAALCRVTNPNARFLLNDMHREAVNLRLIRCNKTGVGQYQCTFKHDYPSRMHKKGTGRTWLAVAAADNPGWYMTVYEGCG